MKYTLLATAAALLAAGACQSDDRAGDYYYGPNFGLGEVETEAPNFGAAWIYSFGERAAEMPHGDVHRLSDGSYSVLRMPGGNQMDLLRISPEGVPMKTISFEVPQTYTGCPFMPNEETFTADASILSYGSFAFRVDLATGGIPWQRQLSGALQHSPTGFWIVDYEAKGNTTVSRLDVATGQAVPALTLGSAYAGKVTDVRLIRERDEDRGASFRGEAVTGETDRILVSVHDGAAGTGTGARFELFDIGGTAPVWTRSVGAQTLFTPRTAVLDGAIVAAFGEQLVALDLETGERRWSTSLQDGRQVDTSLPLLADADGGALRLWDLRGGYHRIAAQTGAPLAYAADARNIDVLSAEMLGSRYLLVASDDGEVALRDADDGSALRSFRGVRSDYHAPVGTSYDADADRLVLAGRRGIYAVDAPATNVIE